jgi:hypothetical protein
MSELFEFRNTLSKRAETFYNMCLMGNIELVKQILTNPHRWFREANVGLKAACIGGHLDIAKLLIDRGADEYNQALRFACIGNHNHIVKYLLEEVRGINWDCNIGLSYACERGNIELLNLLTFHGADDYNHGLYYACKGGKKEIAELMMQHGATATRNATMGACCSNRPEMVRWLIQKTIDLDWNMIFENACVYNWIDLLYYVMLYYSHEIIDPYFIIKTKHYDISNAFINASIINDNRKNKKHSIIIMNVKLYDKNIF